MDVSVGEKRPVLVYCIREGSQTPTIPTTRLPSIVAAAAAPAHECLRHVARAGTQDTTCPAKILGFRAKPPFNLRFSERAARCRAALAQRYSFRFVASASYRAGG